MKYRITQDNIAIITLANIMGAKAVLDFRDILQKTNKTKGIIIDLRNNYGGILANYFSYLKQNLIKNPDFLFHRRNRDFFISEFYSI